MFIIEYLKNRGFLASFLVITGWTYTFIIIGVLIYNIFLYAIGKKYYDEEFKKRVIKEVIESGDCLNVSVHYKINPEIVDRWVRKNKGK